MADGDQHPHARPDRDAMVRFLVDDAVVDEHGRVRAWVGGHVYPEAGGLWLSWAAGEPLAHARAPAVARWLSACIDDDAVGRDGIAYAFDLAVVLAGLSRWARARDDAPDASWCRGAERLQWAVEGARACWPVTEPQRWSRRFGGHLRKLAVLRQVAPELWAAIAAPLVARVGDREPLPFGVDDGEGPAYLHAIAYGLEGQWAHGGTAGLVPAAEQLAAMQRDDGGLPAWWSAAAGAHGPARTDVTAQAIRLWCAIDRGRFDGAIDRGLRFLAARTIDGAVHYDDASRHRNVWCTLFALQALDFTADRARVEALL